MQMYIKFFNYTQADKNCGAMAIKEEIIASILLSLPLLLLGFLTRSLIVCTRSIIQAVKVAFLF
jgi:hypothetical protein